MYDLLPLTFPVCAIASLHKCDCLLYYVLHAHVCACCVCVHVSVLGVFACTCVCLGYLRCVCQRMTHCLPVGWDVHSNWTTQMFHIQTCAYAEC